jgi:hypothetical protein
MADEFIKGLGIFTAGGLGWVVLAGWYRTSSFESSQQLVEPVSLSDSATLFDSLSVVTMDMLFWFTIIGSLTFWVVIPVFRQAREEIENRTQ